MWAASTNRPRPGLSTCSRTAHPSFPLGSGLTGGTRVPMEGGLGRLRHGRADNFSSEKASAALERLKHLTQDLRDRVRVLLHTPNRGKGFAVRRGLEEGAGAWLIFTDVDLPYGLEGVLRVAEKLKAGNDVVVASRLHPDSRLSL